jgi:spore coat protein U domain-containing protein, fimbrial subunit CupE1/2/3/6
MHTMTKNKSSGRFTRVLAVLAALGVGLSVLPAGAADTKQLSVTAVVLSKSNCKFSTNTASNLDFGTLNPASGSTVVQSTSFNARCEGSANPATFTITQNSGLHETGPGLNRMRHVSVATEFIPYSLAINPSSGTVPKGEIFPITVTGTVLGPSYQNALVGNYSDTVVLTIDP